jgi:hypothetical protein
MIIGLTGYHSAGKSDLSQFLAKEFNWQWILKRDLFREWSGVGDNEQLWTEWYRALYQKIGGYGIMHYVLRRMSYKKSSRTVLLFDAIHNPDEWRAIKEVDPDSLLLGVFTPKEQRRERSAPEDFSLDIKREKYWHNENDSQCLLSQVEWAVCGLIDSNLRKLEAKALFDYLVASGRIV